MTNIVQPLRRKRKSGNQKRRAAVLGRFLLLCIWGGALLTAAAGVLAALYAAPGFMLLLAIAGVYFGKRKLQSSGWTMGTGRWSTALERARAGMFGSEGLLIGKTEVPLKKDMVPLLLNPPQGDGDAVCRLFTGGKEAWTRLPRGTHSLICAPSGAGKGTCILMNQYFTDPSSMIIFDPSGEAARRTAQHRKARFGHRVIVMDPFRTVTNTPDTLNCMGHITPELPTGFDECMGIGESLVIKTGQEREPHFNEFASMYISAIVGYVVHVTRPEYRNLQSVAEVFSNPSVLKQAVNWLTESNVWDGMLARLAGQLGYAIDRELGSVLTTVARSLAFCQSVPIAQNMMSSNFDPMGTRDGNTTVYVICPAQYLRSHAGWTRSTINCLLRCAIAAGDETNGIVKVFLDEAASFGHLSCLEDAVERIRGYGVRLTVVLQSIGQIKKLFPDGETTFLSNMDNQIYFGPVNDVQTANMISERLGTETIGVVSHNRSTNWSRSDTARREESWSTGTNDGYGVSDHARKVLTPDEVMNLRGHAIVFTPGVYPVCARLVPYFSKEFQAAFMRKRSGLRKAVCIMVLIAMVALGVLAARAPPKRSAVKQQTETGMKGGDAGGRTSQSGAKEKLAR